MCCLVPKHSKKRSEKSVWYSLFMHVQPPRFFWGTCNTSLHVLYDCTVLNHGNHMYKHLHVVKAMSCALGKVEKSRMALKDELIAIQHVCMARTCL